VLIEQCTTEAEKRNQCRTNYTLLRSPALIHAINRSFSTSGFSSNFLSPVMIPLPNFPIMGHHCVELNLAISIQYGLYDFCEDFEPLLMFVCFMLKFCSKYSSFCHSFCHPLDCAAGGGHTTCCPPSYAAGVTRFKCYSFIYCS
jgi:hypothetical protein